jgi:hypothetical protein
VQAGHLVATSLVPRGTPPQLCQLVEVAPSGPQWVHEIKIDGFRMAARTERGKVQLLTRTGLDWSDKYPAVVAALAKLPAKAAYLDGELCGIGDDGLPSFSQTRRQATAHAKDDLVFVAGGTGVGASWSLGSLWGKPADKQEKVCAATGADARSVALFRIGGIGGHPVALQVRREFPRGINT